jgi:polyhydroxyalkanoate synthesis regulator phasin
VLAQFVSPPYGWDPGCVRVGIAALVRAGSVKILIEKKPYSNPADSDLQIALRVSGNFNKIELVLEDTDIDPDTLMAVRKTLIALTGIKKIDETPSALADAFGVFAAELLGKAQTAANWAEPAALPLPERFKEGRETYGDLQALNNPLHRVKELNARLGYLVDEAAAIRQVDSFVLKWGKTYIEMRRFAQALQPLDFRLPAGGTCQSFLNNWQTATQAASVVDPEIWKDLQNSKAAAELELEQCKNTWRNEARALAQKVIDQLAYDQRVKDIFNEAGRATLIEPLQKFITDLEKENRVETLANGTARIEYLHRQVTLLVDEAWKKKQAAEKKPIKPVETIRLSDVLKITTIQNVGQWEEIRNRLDQVVKDALAKGNEVEIE